MPTKHIPRERAWGTRYDSLPSSPPPTSPSSHLQTSFTLLDSPAASVMPSLRDLSNAASIASNVSVPASPLEKTSHDASIFVGSDRYPFSLPTEVDFTELRRRLHDYLLQYGPVKSVKVIRDQKGGTCAFVQCEDASSARKLLSTLHSIPPRPFLGRLLRYEPARAFRTLLLSYRWPSRAVPLTSSEESFNVASLDSSLPTSIRIYRPRNSKYLTVLCDAEARNFNVKNVSRNVDSPGNVDAFDDEGVLIHPIKYDVDTMLKIVSVFGPVEHFNAYSHRTDDADGSAEHSSVDLARPHPHDAARSPDMDASIWEVKWNHREDCVNALMTLRRVSFLSVSWAHHVGTPSRAGTLPHIFSPALLAPRFGSYDAHTRAQSQPRPIEDDDYWRYGPYDAFNAGSMHSRTFTAPPSSEFSLSPYPWTFAQNTPYWRSPYALEAPAPHGSSATGPTRSPNCPTTDFLALRFPKSADLPQLRDKWEAQHLPGDDLLSSLQEQSVAAGSSASSLSIDTPSVAEKPLSQQNDVVSHQRSPPREEEHASAREAGFVSSSISHFGVKTSPLMPYRRHDSMDHAAHLRSTSVEEAMSKVAPPYGVPEFAGDFVAREEGSWSTAYEGESELDATTIFVGGLEMHGSDAWDEMKLRALFGKYGNIKSVHLVRPAHKQTSFAFITYDQAESSARAVRDVNNREHNGRQIRVQLRDSNARQRGRWRYGRGRGRVPGPFRASSIVCNDNGRAYMDTDKTDNPRKRMEDHQYMSGGISRDNTRSGDAVGSHLSSLSSSTTKVALPTSDSAHDHSAATVASLTPPPSSSSVGPSASAVGASQPWTMPNAGYYAGQPWIPPYSPHYPYPIPIMPGYTGMMQPSAMQAQGSLPPNPSDAGTMYARAPTAWGPPMVPYLPQNNQQIRRQFTQAPSQPPLRPTGFIQGEHGMLIPVYQPEALHQYMSNTDKSQVPSAMMQAPTQPASMWPHYPHLSMYPYAVRFHPQPVLLPTHQGTSSSQRAWTSSHTGITPSDPQQFQTHHAPAQYSSGTNTSGLSTGPSSRGLYLGQIQTSQLYGYGVQSGARRFNRRENA
ncbi:uncharacterized protein LAESUDRAFT_752188 [Laetiporus sulphureus 93-53]|uniref:RRM domain-containing protein n=1 Tax=Laetiporus sulphureus 93-53 TaxID=1314785 RepID=A0A165CAX0_9APHY|nr:uncharacterized protein LAESUDRAFT_752188 [Laetiporus sulphureus 93-53]KZT02481.1 hypothetical protein LAESUDRAFT_752188 [Laetiporus sulphureus 93-53]